jgi:hypothetical protein
MDRRAGYPGRSPHQKPTSLNDQSCWQNARKLRLASAHALFDNVHPGIRRAGIAGGSPTDGRTALDRTTEVHRIDSSGEEAIDPNDVGKGHCPDRAGALASCCVPRDAGVQIERGLCVTGFAVQLQHWLKAAAIGHLYAVWPIGRSL